MKLFGHAPKVQTVTNSKNRAWSNDSSWQMILFDHALYQQITLRLGNPVWVVPGCRGDFLCQWPTTTHTVDRPGADMNDPADSSGHCCPAYVLGASYIYLI